MNEIKIHFYIGGIKNRLLLIKKAIFNKGFFITGIGIDKDGKTDVIHKEKKYCLEIK